MSDDTDFAALYRELGIDTTCSLAGLRSAWRKRVSKLHPDQGGDAEDTGRLQELNRLYDAALNFHERFGRLPGAAHAPRPSGDVTRPGPGGSPNRAETPSSAPPSTEIGKLPRYFIAVSLAAIAVLGWRIAQTDHVGESGKRIVPAADTHSGAGEVHPAQVAIEVLAVAPGMDKQNVRDILGEPLAKHELRWSYGPSWIEFHCDRVIAWYSSPESPLRVKDAAESYTDLSVSNNAPCD